MRANRLAVSVIVGLVVGLATGQVPDEGKVVAASEKVFDRFSKAATPPSPGCAVGVSVGGKSVFEKAFGFAEMEHKVPNTAQTIFESGSVAKQFTAAALVLLAQEGKLSIDDPVRKYIPELPDYGSPLTIRHMLNHTAGLRDWGTVMSLTGAGRGDRAITQELAFDVITHQKSLDFKPGAEYSYSNSGYNLAAIIIERVSKQKFSDFLTERILKPVGMTNTSIRDDYRRIVPGRAQAYSRDGANAPWRLNMPFMSVYGNGGMLTTVGDWLKWNAMLDARTWNAKLVDELETQGVLNDNRKIRYALGLTVAKYNGMRDVSHGGSTAGYQTFLARYPDQKVSVAVLCNGTSPSAGGIAAAITDEIFGVAPAVAANSQVAEEQLQKYAGIWRDERTHTPIRLIVRNGALVLNGARLTPAGGDAFTLGSARVEFTFDKNGQTASGKEIDGDGEVFPILRESEWLPTGDELKALVGDWYSEEAGATFSVKVEDNKAIFVQRPATRFSMTPLYKDHFDVQGYTIWTTRDKAGKIDVLHVGTSRMRDMLFTRISK